MSTTTPTLCACGCGEPVARRYRPGHDQRHKGILQRQAAETRADGTMSRAACDAVALAVEIGFGRYIDEDLLANARVYGAGNIERVHIDSCPIFIRTPDGCGHSNHRCPAITTQAKVAGKINKRTHLAEYSFVERIAASEWTPTGFDICHHCLRDWDWLEWVATTEINRSCYLEAISPSDPPRPTSIPYTIDPDPIPSPFAPPTGNPIPLPPPAPMAA